MKISLNPAPGFESGTVYPAPTLFQTPETIPATALSVPIATVLIGSQYSSLLVSAGGEEVDLNPALTANTLDSNVKTEVTV